MPGHLRHISIYAAAVLCFTCMFNLNADRLVAQEQPSLPDYNEIFGEDYVFAENILKNNSWWADTLDAHGIDHRFALAIVFPELIRYSSIIDYMEIKALEVLYVQYGEDYADFSVGFFQMKPSFAEHIEADILKHDLLILYPHLARLKPDTIDDPAHRIARIDRLQDEKSQLLYLEAFLRIMNYLYPPPASYKPVESTLEFFATAYNVGYFKDERLIEHEINQKHFFTGIGIVQEYYSYSSVSVWYFRRQND
jgi:hypothetical protein